MEKDEFREISDEMIGTDERVCSCASRVVDMIDASKKPGVKEGSPKAMMNPMGRIFTILIGFLHDFAAGCWAATVLAVYRLHKASQGNVGLQTRLVPLEKEFFYLGLFCTCIVLLTGAGRKFTYVGNVYGEDAEKTRQRMLVIKHIILFAIFGAGTYWQYLMVF